LFSVIILNFRGASDERFNLISRGHLRRLLDSWDCKSVTAEAEDLLNRLLCIEPEARFTVDDILKHSWLNLETPTQGRPADAAAAAAAESASSVSKPATAELMSRDDGPCAMDADADDSATTCSQPRFVRSRTLLVS